MLVTADSFLKNPDNVLEVYDFPWSTRFGCVHLYVLVFIYTILVLLFRLNEEAIIISMISSSCLASTQPILTTGCVCKTRFLVSMLYIRICLLLWLCAHIQL